MGEDFVRDLKIELKWALRHIKNDERRHLRQRQRVQVEFVAGPITGGNYCIDGVKKLRLQPPGNGLPHIEKALVLRSERRILNVRRAQPLAEERQIDLEHRGFVCNGSVQCWICHVP